MEPLSPPPLPCCSFLPVGVSFPFAISYRAQLGRLGGSRWGWVLQIKFPCHPPLSRWTRERDDGGTGYKETPTGEKEQRGREEGQQGLVSFMGGRGGVEERKVALQVAMMLMMMMFITIIAGD